MVPAGEHGLNARLGAAELSQTVVIEAGQVTCFDLVIGTGVAVVDSFYTEGMKVEGGDHFTQIFEAKKDLDGNRKEVTYTYGPAATFDLPPGDFVAVVTLGSAVAEVPFTVKVGERVDIQVPLNAGVAAFTFGDGGTYLEVMSATKDINGNRKSIGYAYRAAVAVDLHGRGLCGGRRLRRGADGDALHRGGRRAAGTDDPAALRRAGGASGGRLTLAPASRNRDQGGCSSMVEQKLPKLTTRVRFPSPAPSLRPLPSEP